MDQHIGIKVKIGEDYGKYVHPFCFYRQNYTEKTRYWGPGHAGKGRTDQPCPEVTTDKHTLMNREKGSKYTPVSQIKYMYLFT